MAVPEIEQARDTEVRVAVPEVEKIKVWAKAAGRCVLCAEYLIGETSFFHTTLVGQVAHNVGATSTPGSPRGRAPLTARERALEPNLLLLCAECHRKVDSRELVEYYSEERLAGYKQAHEARVRAVTDFATLIPSFVLRMGSSVRGAFMRASDRQIAEAFRASTLTHGTPDSRDSIVDIELLDPEEWPTTWDRARAVIDDRVAKVRRDASAAGVDTISVFAIAPIPILSYLGTQLDDASAVRLFPPSRRDDDSRWVPSPIGDLDDAHTPTFVVTVGEPSEATEVLLTIGVTAPVRLEYLPDEIASLPRVSLNVGGMHGPDLLTTPAAIADFAAAFRAAMAQLERAFPRATAVHVVAVVPATGAVEIGRGYMTAAQPTLVIYQRTESGFAEAMRLE